MSRPPYWGHVDQIDGMTETGRAAAKSVNAAALLAVAGGEATGAGGWCGLAVLDFGAKGAEVQLAVAVPGVTESSVARAWVALVATAEHSVDEHRVEALAASVAVVPGVGLTVYLRTTDGTRSYGRWSVAWDVR